MKKIVYSLLLLSATCFTTIAQEASSEKHSKEESHVSESGKTVPTVKLVDINGKEYVTSNLGFDGPVIVSFWATWCAPCKRELNTIHEDYADLVEETGVTMVAVSIDDEKTKANVPGYANAKSWEYVVLLDPNGDFKRAMGVGNPPHTFILNKKGEIIYSHAGYSPGDEEKVYEIVRAEAAKK
jgi:cytochrome c biogenesis protein CcmG, thiol:disulfide interchange protein DsbE